jgi:hypothetical protein
MAQHFTFYNRDTGNIEKVIFTDQRSANRILEFNDSLVCVNGSYDYKKYRFDLTQTPPAPVLHTDTNVFNCELLIRQYRDAKLQASDWTQGADSPLSEDKKVAWASYRQSLRDITKIYNNTTVKNEDDFKNIQWPAAPG